MRTRGVSAEMLRTSPAVGPRRAHHPRAPARAREGHVGPDFFCGAGVSAYAYAPLLRPVAEAGSPVFIVKLP